MKNSISKLVIVGTILASTLAVASAAPRYQERATGDAVYNNHFDSEQAQRDRGGQGG